MVGCDLHMAGFFRLLANTDTGEEMFDLPPFVMYIKESTER